MSTLERRTAIERLKYIASHSNPHDGFSIIPTADLEMLLAVVEAAKRQRDEYDEDRPTSFELDRALEALES